MDLETIYVAHTVLVSFMVGNRKVKFCMYVTVITRILAKLYAPNLGSIKLLAKARKINQLFASYFGISPFAVVKTSRFMRSR
jgi:hypothetical protein